MSRAKQASKPKRLKKAIPVLGAAGLSLSLSLASGAPAATGGLVADVLTPTTGVSHEITLAEEEISDVSLATFYVSDKENVGTFRHLVKFAHAGCGCWTGANFGAPTPGSDTNPTRHSNKPGHKYTHTDVPKSP
jgi:hypothetical protein